MMKQYASMFVLLAFALTPALAKDKHQDAWQRLTEKWGNAEDRIEGLQQRLQGDDLSDRERDRIEDRIQDIADKFGVVLPPPPEPEPTVLFHDDFNRENGTGINNGWTEHGGQDNSIRIEDSKAVFQTDTVIGTNGINSGYAQTPTFHADYKITTVTYTVDGMTGSGLVESAWTVNGNTWIPGASTPVTEGGGPTIVSYNLADSVNALPNPDPYLGSVADGNFAVAFSFFSDNGSTGNIASIDDLSLTQPAPTSEPFVGY